MVGRVGEFAGQRVDNLAELLGHAGASAWSKMVRTGGNTSFGFQAGYSGSNTAPTLACAVN